MEKYYHTYLNLVFLSKFHLNLLPLKEFNSEISQIAGFLRKFATRANPLHGALDMNNS